MITAWCWDKSDLVFKSEVDVRSCAGYRVVVDATAHLRCGAKRAAIGRCAKGTPHPQGER
jgi:hypothetical protein